MHMCQEGWKSQHPVETDHATLTQIPWKYETVAPLLNTLDWLLILSEQKYERGMKRLWERGRRHHPGPCWAFGSSASPSCPSSGLPHTLQSQLRAPSWGAPAPMAPLPIYPFPSLIWYLPRTYHYHFFFFHGKETKITEKLSHPFIPST